MESSQSLGRYELTAHIARGGMADVFEATDRMLDRRVAVKILHQRYADTDTFVARFRKEAQAAANLSHPNIVSIYDWGEKDGTYFIVMELIKGRSLRDVVRSEGSLLPRRAAEIAAEVASALEVAHRNRVIHRDIKPGNVLLAADGTVKVTDFGVARAWDDSHDLTKAGSVIGTASYFSPEQARGDPADERSDIYSLGVVLYEMLVGRPPFSGETPVSVAYQHVTAGVPPPGRLNPDVPIELENIVMRSLEKDPARRYRSAAGIRRDLLLFLQGRTFQSAAPAQPPPVPAQVSRRTDLPPPTVTPDEVYRRLHATPRQPSQLPFVITSIALAAGVVIGVYYLLSVFRPETTTPTTSPPVTTIEVPNVVGTPQDLARQVLQDAGLRVTPVNEASDLEPGTVIRTDPEAGDPADDLFVTMVVSAGPTPVLVPPVVGFTEERAKGRLEGQGFVVVVLTARDESVGAGRVISQAPPGESGAPRGSTVEVLVSAGPEPIEMPRVIGWTRDRAEGLLEGLELDVETSTVVDNDVEGGIVISQTPSAGSEINPGRTVQIVVSEAPDRVELEELSGRPLGEVTSRLEELGLEAVIHQENSSEVAAGIVIRTEPPGGTAIDLGDRVTVVESIGPRYVAVPDLTGATEDEAEATLAARGLLLEVAISPATVSEPELDGRVARQAPKPGDELLEGETVLAVLGKYSAPVDEPETADGNEDESTGDTG